MANEVANLHALSDQLLRTASQMQSQTLGTLLKFSKGEYFIGEDDVTGQERIAHVEAAMRGYVKFWDGKPVPPQYVGRIADGYRLPSRDELGDLDEKKWQRDTTGKPKDPWSLQYYVPMEDLDDGSVAIFVTSSNGGINALGKLFDVCARNVKNGLPIVKLGVRSYQHSEFGKIKTPDFPVVSWDGGHVVAPPVAKPPSHSAKEDPTTGRPRKADDMDDDIPF
jgi:hypothetical protein